MPGGTINMLIASFTLYNTPNGFFILPLLAFGTQFFSNTLTTGQQPTAPAANGQPNTGKFMKWFFPIFSVYICATSNAAFSLYWVAANVVAMVQQFAFKRLFAAQEAKAVAQTEEVDKL
jgi:membrane protein insertase Oxa1/YidC/SpoIIIJ